MFNISKFLATGGWVIGVSFLHETTTPNIKDAKIKEKIKGAVRKTPSPIKIVFFKELTTRFF
jgi:hypothetical protein